MQKLHRLSKHADLHLLFMRGKKADLPFFRLIIGRNTLGLMRLVCVVSRAVDKRAVIRTRLRRRTREWLRKNLPSPNTGLDIAIIFKKQAAEATRGVLYEKLACAKHLIMDPGGSHSRDPHVPKNHLS